MNVTHKISMDLTRPTNGNRINVVEGDRNSRIVNVHLYENSVSWRVPTDASVLIKWERESGVGGEYSQLSDGSSAWSAVGNVLTITLSEESTEYSGNVKFSIVLTSGDSQISTFLIIANVHAVANGKEEANSGTSSADIAGLQKQIGNLSKLETENKSNLVEAINEVASSDSSQNANHGWTTEQVNLLDQLFDYIPWTSSDAGAIADSLIASLRSDDTGGEEEPDEPVPPEVTLSSISATYSGGSVPVGTAVTALTGIVVTAHYSDGTSKAVTGYTLSGTIAEGSNTVTVSYGGKSATFTVTGVAESGGETEGVAVTMLDEAKISAVQIDWYQGDALIQQKADNTQSVVKANGSNFNWYTDGGATPYTGDIATRAGIQCYTGETVFDEDTEVKVLIKTYGSQAFDLYAIGCTPDWDGVSAPSGKNVYNCYIVGAEGYKSGIDHEIAYTVKAGTRLVVASYASTVKVCILNQDATLNEVSAPNIQKMSISQAVFEKDTQVHIVASSETRQYDSMAVGCTNHDGSLNANGVYQAFDVFFTEPVGDNAWENPPYSVDITYTVKAGYRLVFGTHWTRAKMNVFAVTEVA